MIKKRTNGSRVQAVLFDKSLFTPEEARKWLVNHKLPSRKRVHITDKYLRYRILEPNQFARFRTKQIKEGIKLIIGMRG